jgi:dihydropteroate synthase
LFWQTSRFRIDLNQPQVMAIVNLTPDSFSGDGLWAGADHRRAQAQCERMVQEGAHMLDIGAESSRPGAQPISAEEELARLLPVVRFALDLGVPVSVDTCKPQVMRAVLDLGADIINDIWALRQPGALEAVAAHGACGICLMHMHRQPQTMQVQPMQGTAIEPVRDFLRDQVQRACAAGVDRSRLVVDAGVGFGKTVAQNFELLAHQSQLHKLGLPLIAAWSRKSSLGTVMGGAGPSVVPDQRLPGSLAAAVLAVERGARIVRVHDVRETVQALRVWQAARG